MERPKAKKIQSVCVPSAMGAELEKRAESMGVTPCFYCSNIIRRWLKSGQKLTLSE
jgi:hypothetical protein